MVYRYGWIAGAAAITFGLWRLSRLLDPTESGPRWQFVVFTSLVLGIVITWTTVSYRMKAGWIVVLNFLVFLIAAGRYGAPETGWWIFPNPETISTLYSEIEHASGLIRHGIEPVFPIEGLVIVLAALFWGLGALLAFGLLKERPFVALIPPLVVGLQLLTIERKPSSNLEIALFVLLVAATALAVGMDEHDRGAGRMASPGAHPSPARSAPLSGTAFLLVVVTVFAAIGVSTALANRVPADGVITWRAGGSLTAGQYGTVSYNNYVSIHDGLVSHTQRELFTASLEGSARRGDVYYRLITLDTYGDGDWSPEESPLVGVKEARFEKPAYKYAGPTERVTASFTIHALGQDFLPAPYAVRGVDGEDSASFRLRTIDASVAFSGNRTYRGMEYEVVADVPVMDSGAVALDATGRLSPLFLVAAEDGRAVPVPRFPAVHRVLPDAERYLQLPDDIDPQIATKATELTSGLTTNFEKGLALEYWFRETGNFTYSLDVGVGGHGPDVVAGWLFDEEAADYRTGYCEDFATSMGVMARTLGIPTRVVLGFLPGEPVGDSDVLVRDINGHSWIELWIPSQGWMRFDPTPRSDGLNPNAMYQTIQRDLNFDLAAYLGQVPEGSAGDEPFTPLDTSKQPEQGLPGGPLPLAGAEGDATISVTATVALWLLIGIAAVIGGIPAIKWSRRRSRMRRLARGDIAGAWEAIVAQLADLDTPVDPARTPNEVATAVDPALEPLATVYSKSIYGQGGVVTSSEVDAATRSMTVTSERLGAGRSSSQRLRSTYRLSSLIGRDRLSRWLPWLRP